MGAETDRPYVWCGTCGSAGSFENCAAAAIATWNTRAPAAQVPEVAALTARNETWQRNSRETFDAMCAMLNSINEYVPMPSLESDLLQGPENSVFCTAVAEAVVSKVAELTQENERLNAHIEGVAKDTHKLLVAAEAKVARLEGALRRIADGNPTIDSPEADAQNSASIARAALTEETPE
jgi:hypothetical protein